MGQCLRHTTLHTTTHCILWKTLHLPAETFKLVTVFKTRNGISSFWLASFFFSLGKEPSLDAEGWLLGIGKLGISGTFSFKLLYKVSLPQEGGNLLFLGKKNSTRWTRMRLLCKQSYFAECLQKFTSHFRTCVPQKLWRSLWMCWSTVCPGLHQPLAPGQVLPVQPPQGPKMNVPSEGQWSPRHTIWVCCSQAWIKVW